MFRTVSGESGTQPALRLTGDLALGIRSPTINLCVKSNANMALEHGMKQPVERSPDFSGMEIVLCGLTASPLANTRRAKPLLASTNPPLKSPRPHSPDVKESPVLQGNIVILLVLRTRVNVWLIENQGDRSAREQGKATI